MVHEEQVRTAVDWMMERWIPDDSRARFKAALEAVIRRECATNTRWFRLEVDYDPRDLLLEAVRAAGVECSGVMFSARGLFRGGKFYLQLFPDRTEAKLGYGNWANEPIWKQ